jgi:hypothetical protein
MSDEFSRLLSEVAKSADMLNRESDSVNELIERFQATLRSLNVGLEVWLPIIEKEQLPRTSGSGTQVLRTYLGVARLNGAWTLAVKATTGQKRWDEEEQEAVEEDLYETPPSPLLSASREVRIRALGEFPVLLNNLKREADAAIMTIQSAKKFVKDDATECLEFAKSVLKKQ